MDIDNIQLLSNFVNKDHNKIKPIENLKYIHFYDDECINLYFKQHFVNFNNSTYYADFFVNNGILEIITNNNSPSILQIKNKINEIEYKEFNIDKAIIFYSNTRSAGHEMANILHTIYLYNLNNLEEYDIIITKKFLNLGNFMIDFLYFFIPKNKIHFVDNRTIVNINKSFVNYPPSSKQNISVDFLLNKLKIYKIDAPKNKVCFIKTYSSTCMNSKNRCFNDDYKEYFINKGFMFVNPESLNLIDLYNLINNTTLVVLSWGCNCWINSTFIEEDKKVIILCHIGYSCEYNSLKNVNNLNSTQWTPKCEKLLFIKDLNTEINTELMDESLSEF